MAYLNVDDQAGDHPKLEVLSDAAHRLWFKALLYCKRYRTDGHIPADAVRRLRNWSEKTQAELTKVLPPFTGPLWHVADDGSVQIHDFLDWNESRSEIDRRRSAKKDRMKAWRDKKDAPRDASRDVPQDTPRDAPRAPAHIHSHNHIHSVAKATQGTAPLVGRRSGKALNDGDAVQCPSALRAEFEAVIATRIGPHEDPYTRLLTWTHDVSDALVAEYGGVPQAFLEDAFKAWRQRLAQDWGIADKPAAPAPCRGLHQPPCPDDAVCTRRRAQDAVRRDDEQEARERGLTLEQLYAERTAGGVK